LLLLCIALPLLPVPSARFRALSAVLRPCSDIAAVLLLACAGMLHCSSALATRDTGLLQFSDKRERVLLTGVVAEDPRVSPGKLRFRMDCRRIVDADTLPVSGRVLVSYRRSAWDDDDTLTPVRWGDVLTLRCRLHTPLPPRNPGGFDARTWMIGEGCLLFCGVSKGADLQVTGFENPGPAARAITAVRAAVRKTFHAMYRDEHAALMIGLLLGDRGLIDEETMEDFRTAGIMHILAVSGLHAGIILLIVFMPLERLRYPLRAGIALLGLWFFAAMTGLAPPVVRAALMSSLFLGGVVLQRRSDAVNALAAAALIILLADPTALLGLSFQLSFTAVLGILLFHEHIQNALLRPLPRHLRHGVAAVPAGLAALTLSAQALSMPLLASAFGQVSPSGILTNLAAVPMVFIAVTCGVLSVITAALPFLAVRFAATAAAALDIILTSSDVAASLPFASVSLPSVPSLAWLGYVPLLFWFTAYEGRLRQKLVLLTCLLLAGWSVSRTTMESEALLRVTFLDVGQGDAAVLHLPGGEAMVIDAGAATEGYDAGERVILPYLRHCGMRRLHTLVITHPDNDHRGGADAVLEELPVGDILLGGSWPKDGAAGALLSRMHERVDSVRDVRAGTRIVLPGGAVLYVLSPPEGEHCEASNEHSVVFLLVHGQTRILFTGDADVEAEQRMVERYGDFLQADVLKVGHHGSATSSCAAFVSRVRPKHAVISAGRNNRFKHPDALVLRRLQLAGADIHRTDIEGTVIFVSDGERIRKEHWRENG
jgi:competence protein ComEC